MLLADTFTIFFFLICPRIAGMVWVETDQPRMNQVQDSTSEKQEKTTQYISHGVK